MHCKIFATPLGSIIGWVEDHSYQGTDSSIPFIDLSEQSNSNLKVFDACYITSRPFISECQEDNGTIVDVENSLITEYVPIRPNESPYLTYIDLNLDNVIYSYPVLDADEENIKTYINKIMGRMPTKNATEN